MLVQASKDAVLRLINRENLSGQGCCGKVGGEVHQLPYTDGFVLTAPLAWQDPATNGLVWVFVVSTNDESPAAGLHAYTILTDAHGASTLNLNYTLPDAGTSPFMANNLLFTQVRVFSSTICFDMVFVTGTVCVGCRSRATFAHWNRRRAPCCGRRRRSTRPRACTGSRPLW